MTLRSVGAAGGQAAAFTYDLARSVVYTRQGNPAWAGTERDGTGPVRSDDLFFGGAQDDWVDLARSQIPQADEQQRLLANLITQMNLDRTPLPRFWYLPRGAQAAVVMTGDDHGSRRDAGAVRRASSARAPAGCSVADWECVRATSYVYPEHVRAGARRRYQAGGFEIALHLDTSCANQHATARCGACGRISCGEVQDELPASRRSATNRTTASRGAAGPTTRIVEREQRRAARHELLLLAGLVGARTARACSPGRASRCASRTPTDRSIDVYQATTQLTDESAHRHRRRTPRALLDGALGPKGYYGVFTANMHTDADVTPAGRDRRGGAGARASR